jgi:hypothetical protein
VRQQVRQLLQTARAFGRDRGWGGGGRSGAGRACAHAGDRSWFGGTIDEVEEAGVGGGEGVEGAAGGSEVQCHLLPKQALGGSARGVALVGTKPRADERCSCSAGRGRPGAIGFWGTSNAAAAQHRNEQVSSRQESNNAAAAQHRNEQASSRQDSNNAAVAQRNMAQ